MIDYEKDAELFKVLGNPIRLKIIDTIRDGEACVRTLEKMTGASQSCVSQHLAILRNSGIVESYRDGHLVCYSLNHDLIGRLLNCVHDENIRKTQANERMKEE